MFLALISDRRTKKLLLHLSITGGKFKVYIEILPLTFI